MDFGKLEDISGVDFSLPASHSFTAEVLAKSTSDTKAVAYVGPPIWANKDWIGKIYPSNAKDKDYLYYYTRQFNTIELNVTHYQVPTPAMIERWRSNAAQGFKFCPKWPQAISHERQLQGTDLLSKEFVDAVLPLGEFLGTTFLQLAPYFEPRQLPILTKFLKNLPPNFPISVEFRHEGWFADKTLWLATLQMLHELGVGTVISDVAGRRDVVHQSLSTPRLVLRFVGNELHPTDYKRVDAWVAQIKNWVEQGLQEVYIFVHCGENKLAPELTKYWIEQLNKEVEFNLKPPHIQPQVIQGSLF